VESIELFKAKGDIITVSRGPQFKAKGGPWIAMLGLGFFVFAVVFLLKGYFLSFFFLFTISFISVYYILDIHGLQLDKNKRRIRDYRFFMWQKTGKWENIEDFKSIYITKNYLSLPTMIRGKSETYHYYHVKLVDKINKKEFLLAEYTNYYKALKISQNISFSTGLELVDMIKGENRSHKKNHLF
jgi:hypothetical protein